MRFNGWLPLFFWKEVDDDQSISGRMAKCCEQMRHPGMDVLLLTRPSNMFYITEEWWVISVNLVIISIPLVLLYGSIYALVWGWHERSSIGEVSPHLTKIIYWAPRVAAILITFFMSLFSLDVFGMGVSHLEVLGAFLMHNIPSIIMIFFLAFAWKRPVVDFVVFLIAGIAFTISFVRDIYALPNLLLSVFPILLIASLFYANWKWLNPSGNA
jgi:hypothetical protein